MKSFDWLCFHLFLLPFFFWPGLLWSGLRSSWSWPFVDGGHCNHVWYSTHSTRMINPQPYNNENNSNNDNRLWHGFCVGISKRLFTMKTQNSHTFIDITVVVKSTCGWLTGISHSEWTMEFTYIFRMLLLCG